MSLLLKLLRWKIFLGKQEIGPGIAHKYSIALSSGHIVDQIQTLPERQQQQIITSLFALTSALSAARAADAGNLPPARARLARARRGALAAVRRGARAALPPLHDAAARHAACARAQRAAVAPVAAQAARVLRLAADARRAQALASRLSFFPVLSEWEPHVLSFCAS